MTEAQNKLYEKAKQYAKENVKGNCDELKCLAVMLYEFAIEATKELQEEITDLSLGISIRDEDMEKLKKENTELKASLEWEQNTKSELAEHLGKANDKNAELEDKLANADYQLEGRDMKIKELEQQIEKMKFALNKIIKTVQNDIIYSYGERLVKIYDISCEVLQELEK